MVHLRFETLFSSRDFGDFQCPAVSELVATAMATKAEPPSQAPLPSRIRRGRTAHYITTRKHIELSGEPPHTVFIEGEDR